MKKNLGKYLLCLLLSLAVPALWACTTAPLRIAAGKSEYSQQAARAAPSWQAEGFTAEVDSAIIPD